MSEYQKFMTRQQILDTIKDLSRFQGRYARLYDSIMQTKELYPESYDQYMNHLVNQQFVSIVDLVLYFEDRPTF